MHTKSHFPARNTHSYCYHSFFLPLNLITSLIGLMNGALRAVMCLNGPLQLLARLRLRREGHMEWRRDRFMKIFACRMNLLLWKQNAFIELSVQTKYLKCSLFLLLLLISLTSSRAKGRKKLPDVWAFGSYRVFVWIPTLHLKLWPCLT